MFKKILFPGILVLLLATAAGPAVVFAGVDPLASPTPQPTQRITAPVISGVNPDAVLSEGNLGISHPSDSFKLVDALTSVPVNPPVFLDLESTSSEHPGSNPILNHEKSKVDCGPAALAQALNILDPVNGSRPYHLNDFLADRGLIYEWGTGVEELVFAAREFGFKGSYAFQDWNMDQVVDVLRQGNPIVIPLGMNGPGRPGHFVTLTGVSEGGDWIRYHDPSSGEIILSTEKFLSLWKIQGNTGMIPQKAFQGASYDPMLPVMGLFSAISALALTLKGSAGLSGSRLFERMRKQLANPRRKGIGAGPLPPKDLEVIKPPGYEEKIVFKGMQNVEMEIPVFETRKVKIGIRGVKKEIPQYETRRVQVGIEKKVQQVPIYVTKKVKTGTKFVKKELPITRYKTANKMVWKKFTTRVPIYRYLGSKRIITGYKNQVRWKRVPVLTKIPYQTKKKISIEVPVYQETRDISGYKAATVEVPTYEMKKILVGHKTVMETVPVFEERQVQVGTEIITRQIPQYETVRIFSGNDEKLLKNVNSLNAIERKLKEICEDDERLKELYNTKKFEITNAVFLKGGPGAGFGIEKVEKSWSGHSGGGGGSTWWMLLFKLITRTLVWIRDATPFLEKMGNKPDAQATIMFSNDEGIKNIESIIVMNKGYEELTVKSIVVQSKNEDSSNLDGIQEIYLDNEQNGNNSKIGPGSYRVYSNIDFSIDEAYFINLLHIKLSSNSNRSGFITHKINPE